VPVSAIGAPTAGAADSRARGIARVALAKARLADKGTAV
jgi:hypothetical protein